MYSLLNGLLSDRKGGVAFTCFGIWHWCYIAVAVLAALAIFFGYKNKSEGARRRVLNVIVGIVFGLYIADFFLMPFAYGEIDIEKLPFHACTSMCVMSFLSRHVRRLENYAVHFALLGLISNLVYLIYPAGVMWYEVHPLSYRVIQTLLFHAVMTVYGVLTLAFEGERLKFKKCYRDVVIIVALTVWAFIGNTLYSGAAGDYSREFNWFFLNQDPLGVFPEAVAPYIMPALNVAVFFAAEMMIYSVCFCIRRLTVRRTSPKFA
ncbi:MAG: YwaF family protein [Clostridia bacterium]|nr:YwaF family protein [Clostridia bacterium]